MPFVLIITKLPNGTAVMRAKVLGGRNGTGKLWKSRADE
jgi:hypothetical protein